MFFTYILHTVDCLFYTGITVDVPKRIFQHLHAKRGFTSRHRPKSIIYLCSFPTRKLSRQFEVLIKHRGAYRFICICKSKRSESYHLCNIELYPDTSIESLKQILSERS